MISSQRPWPLDHEAGQNITYNFREKYDTMVKWLIKNVRERIEGNQMKLILKPFCR